MAPTLTISIALVTAAFAPIWVQHFVADDAGLIGLGGGKISQKDVDGFHPLMRHLCAMVAVSNFACAAAVLAGTYFGSAKVKLYSAIIYLLWLAGVMTVQYTHSWTGQQPALMDMPNPLIYGAVTVVALGFAFDGPAAKTNTD
eukprot:g3417.t1